MYFSVAELLGVGCDYTEGLSVMGKSCNKGFTSYFSSQMLCVTLHFFITNKLMDYPL